jgi:all-trans-retinol 13,14-reductase
MKKEEQHIVIVGSGLGGLTCGYILAKNGYRVTILEKDRQFGGCLQTFTRYGVKFETGMHYIGSMKPGQALYRYFKYFSLLKDVPLSALDELGYDIISLRGNRYPIASGEEPFVNALSRYFPGSEGDLHQFKTGIREIVDELAFCSFDFSRPLVSDSHYAGISAGSFLEKTINNELLRDVLAGNVWMFAGIKDKTPLHLYALVHDFYNQSAFRFIGGSDAITDSLVRSIRTMGGEVLSLSKVTELRCDDRQVKSAVLSNGNVIEGDVFISDVHPTRTLELLSTPLIRPIYRKRVINLPNTIACFTLYLCFKPNTVPYMNSNFYHYSSQSVWGCEKYDDTTWPKQFFYLHLCEREGQQYANGAEVITYMHYDEVARWENSSSGNRGESYEAFKEEKVEKLMDALEREMPGIRKNILYYDASTPLTYRDYTGTERGSMYGIQHDCAEPIRSYISYRTKIPNFFFAGQNVYSHGILGVMISSFITCAEMIGMKTLVEQLDNLTKE